MALIIIQQIILGDAFWLESDMDIVRQELTLLRDTNLNTLRIFLWNEALFQCFGSGAIPNPSHFQRLDAFMQIARRIEFSFNRHAE